MRVIAGTARSLKLKTISGMDTRPTTDRTKETLFNMLQPYIPGCRFLDLFAGSGAIGIEALSRGADSCVFAENNKKAVACIKENLQFTKLDSNARILTFEIPGVLNQLEGEPPFDCIFMDPPYDQGLEQEVLSYCRDASFVDLDTLFIIEASLQTKFDYLSDLGYDMIKEKKYKTNQHVFVQKSKEKRKWQ